MADSLCARLLVSDDSQVTAVDSEKCHDDC